MNMDLQILTPNNLSIVIDSICNRLDVVSNYEMAHPRVRQEIWNLDAEIMILTEVLVLETKLISNPEIYLWLGETNEIYSKSYDPERNYIFDSVCWAIIEFWEIYDSVEAQLSKEVRDIILISFFPKYWNSTAFRFFVFSRWHEIPSISQKWFQIDGKRAGKVRQYHIYITFKSLDEQQVYMAYLMQVLSRLSVNYGINMNPKRRLSEDRKYICELILKIDSFSGNSLHTIRSLMKTNFPGIGEMEEIHRQS